MSPSLSVSFGTTAASAAVMRKRLCVLVLLVAVAVGLGSRTSAQPSPPRILPVLPVPQIPPSAVSRSASAVTASSLPPLKAVLIVGPIDGATGSATQLEKTNMELAAAELEANGVAVQRFYAPNTNWSAIESAAEGAHFLLYRGHGVYWPGIADFPSPYVGGFYLSDDTFISPDQIRQDIRLAPNAIVMLYGCFTAGHSGGAEDHRDIGVEEAARRVAQYSDPFLHIGAAGYYANWFGNAFQMFLRSLFGGSTLGDAYEAYFDFNASTVHRTTHSEHPEAAMWLDKDFWSGYWQYNNAFAGSPNETIASLFASPTLGDLPHTVQFTYSISDARLIPALVRETVQNVTTGDILQWSISKQGAWFEASPAAGQTPTDLVVTPDGFGTTTASTYTGSITVTVTSPEGTMGSPHRMNLSLEVIQEPLPTAYLPLVQNRYSPPPPDPVVPDDPLYSSQWALDKIGAPEAWGITKGSISNLIAVIDTGTDLDHVDMASKTRTDIDKDYVNDDFSADDDNGHGTHVAGIAAAATGNGVGIAGLDWKAEILPLKILDSAGDGNTLDLSDAIRYAADQGADVVNMSLSSAAACPTYLQDAADYAHGHGVLLVAAAGNNEGHSENLPANCNHVIGVSATNQDDSRASYSNYGNHVSVAAPGTSILSTVAGNTYDYKSGTSMATPYVSGVASLVWATRPSYSPAEVTSALVDNAVDLGASGWDPYFGCGRVSAFASVYSGAHAASPECVGGGGIMAIQSVREGAASAPYVPGEIIVSLAPGASIENLRLAPGQIVRSTHPRSRAWLLHVVPGLEKQVVRQLLGNPSVANAELNLIVSAQ